jgi:spermidine synthase
MAARIGRIGGPAVFAVILAGTLIGAWSLRAAAPGRLAGAAIAAGSFTLMAAEVLLILAFQVFHGHVYHRIALLIASLMVGMAAGTHLANRGLDRANVRWLAALHAALAGYAMIFLALAAALAGCAPPDGLVPWLFLFLAALAGGLVGFEFPVANKLYLAARGAPGAAAGVVYGLDLAGSCLGALLVGVWLLPVIGLAWTLFILAGLNLVVSASLFAAARRPSPS